MASCTYCFERPSEYGIKLLNSAIESIERAYERNPLQSYNSFQRVLPKLEDSGWKTLIGRTDEELADLKRKVYFSYAELNLNWAKSNAWAPSARKSLLEAEKHYNISETTPSIGLAEFKKLKNSLGIEDVLKALPDEPFSCAGER